MPSGVNTVGCRFASIALLLIPLTKLAVMFRLGSAGVSEGKEKIDCCSRLVCESGNGKPEGGMVDESIGGVGRAFRLASCAIGDALSCPY